MTLALKEGQPFAERVLTHAGGWACTEPGCAFRRKYATAAGALNGAIEHMARKHSITLSLPRTQPPQNARAAIQARIESALARQRTPAALALSRLAATGPAEPERSTSDVIAAAAIWSLFL